MTKRILCRADGNSEIGLGHIYRMLAVAEFYKENYELVFVTKEDSTGTVIPKKYKTIHIPKTISINEEPQWLINNFLPSQYIIIADGYQFVSSYQKEIKFLGFTLIYIDDLVKEYMYADVVVNHSPECTPRDFKSESYTKFALGTSYAMLRPLFNKAAKQERNITDINNAFVCFGGADPLDLTLRATKALLNIKTIKNIHVVLGGAYKHKAIFSLEENNDSLYLYRNLDENALLQLMQSCQIAVAPSSTILYELCSVKMPVLSGYYVENQKNIYNGLVKKEVIFEGGDFTNYTVSDFEIKIKAVLESDIIDSHIKNQHQLFNGENKKNFLSLMDTLNISFRKANEKDVLDVFNWSNDEIVRKNSYNSDPILFANHETWFFKKIKDKNTLFLIALVNNKPAGIVRYEVESDFSIVGILVSKEFRGLKLASEFLKKSAGLYFDKYGVPVLAYIKKENKPSVKAFTSAGYTYLKDENIKGSISFIYKLENHDVGQ